MNEQNYLNIIQSLDHETKGRSKSVRLRLR